MGTGSTDIKHTLSRCSNVWIEDGDDDIFIQDNISDDDIAQYGQYLTKGADADYTQNGYDIILTDEGAEKFLYLMLQLWEDYTQEELIEYKKNYGIPGYFLVYNKKLYADLPFNPADNDHGLIETTHYTKTHGDLVWELTDAGKAKLEDSTS